MLTINHPCQPVETGKMQNAGGGIVTKSLLDIEIQASLRFDIYDYVGGELASLALWLM